MGGEQTTAIPEGDYPLVVQWMRPHGADYGILRNNNIKVFHRDDPLTDLAWLYVPPQKGGVITGFDFNRKDNARADFIVAEYTTKGGKHLSSIYHFWYVFVYGAVMDENRFSVTKLENVVTADVVQRANRVLVTYAESGEGVDDMAFAYDLKRAKQIPFERIAGEEGATVRLPTLWTWDQDLDNLYGAWAEEDQSWSVVHWQWKKGSKKRSPGTYQFCGFAKTEERVSDLTILGQQAVVLTTRSGSNALWTVPAECGEKMRDLVLQQEFHAPQGHLLSRIRFGEDQYGQWVGLTNSGYVVLHTHTLEGGKITLRFEDWAVLGQLTGATEMAVSPLRRDGTGFRRSVIVSSRDESRMLQARETQ